MTALFKTIVTQSCKVLWPPQPVPCKLYVSLIDSLLTDLTVCVFKVINLLCPVSHIFSYVSAYLIFVGELLDLDLALWARVFHLIDPLLNARMAVLV